MSNYSKIWDDLVGQIQKDMTLPDQLDFIIWFLRSILLTVAMYIFRRVYFMGKAEYLYRTRQFKELLITNGYTEPVIHEALIPPTGLDGLQLNDHED